MSIKLIKPFSEKDYADFVVENNHKKGLRIEETEAAVFALEPNEMLKDDEVCINPNYETEVIKSREEQFKKEFFETSLGWIRRKVRMKDGSQKDFLSDLLIPIKVGLELGKSVEIVTYVYPDMTQNLTNDYMQSLQVHKFATPEFISECLTQTVNDFGG